MSNNLTKTEELVVRGRSKAPIPTPLPGIEQVDNIKLLGMTFCHSPNNWDSHFDTSLSKGGKRMYMLRICKKFGYSQENLHYLFNILIMSLFKYALPVWGCASYSTYLVNIDKLQNRAVKFGYLKYTIPINDLIESSDNTIWNNIKNNPGHPLAQLLPPQ